MLIARFEETLFVSRKSHRAEGKAAFLTIPNTIQTGAGGFRNVLLIGGTEQSLAPFRATEATFLVNDITAWEKHLPSTGATIINPVSAVPTGWNMLVRHPDGMIAEYVEHHDKNPADEIF